MWMFLFFCFRRKNNPFLPLYTVNKSPRLMFSGMFLLRWHSQWPVHLYIHTFLWLKMWDQLSFESQIEKYAPLLGAFFSLAKAWHFNFLIGGTSWSYTKMPDYKCATDWTGKGEPNCWLILKQVGCLGKFVVSELNLPDYAVKQSFTGSITTLLAESLVNKKAALLICEES